MVVYKFLGVEISNRVKLAGETPRAAPDNKNRVIAANNYVIVGKAKISISNLSRQSN